MKRTKGQRQARPGPSAPTNLPTVRTLHELALNDADLAIVCSPRDDIVRERLLSSGPDAADHAREIVFTQDVGPFVRYRRRVTIPASPKPQGWFRRLFRLVRRHRAERSTSDRTAGDSDGKTTSTPHTRVRETFDFQLSPGAWRFLTVPLLSFGLRKTSITRHTPWWAPTQRLDSPRALAVLGRLATLSFVIGYLSGLIGQTMTFAAEEFDAGSTAQGVVLSGVRLGGFLAIGLSVLADRRGRARLLLLSVVISVLATAAGALAPHIAGLGMSQAVSRGGTTAAAALVGVVLAEEMPKGARAWAVGQVTMAGGAGFAPVLFLLPLADLSEQAWRILYAVPLLVLPPLLYHIRRVPETRRFARPHTEVPVSKRLSRFWLVAGLLILLNVFVAPTSQFRNEFLRDERAFNATSISIFVAVTGGLAAIGIFTGGRMAEKWGRRYVGAGAAIGSAVGITASFIVGGPTMWLMATLGMIVSAALIPSTGVYGAELFPTSLRGAANGTAGALAMGGSVIGLLAVGTLADRIGSFGPAIALVATAPVLAALLILTKFPETARTELEDLNPEDKVPVPAAPGGAEPTAHQSQPLEEVTPPGRGAE